MGNFNPDGSDFGNGRIFIWHGMVAYESDIRCSHCSGPMMPINAAEFRCDRCRRDAEPVRVRC